MTSGVGSSLTFRDKAQLIADLRSTYTIWSRDHGLEEAILIATGGRERRDRVVTAIGAAVDAIGANAGVRAVINHAVQTIEAS